MTLRTPPSNASITLDPDQNGKLFAPSAARNITDVCAALKSIAPQSGNALEIASGTGQHIIAFATAMPNITWHPTEVEATRLTSIQAYIREATLTNLVPPMTLNATQTGWASKVPEMNLITLANLLHLISEKETETLISEAAQAVLLNGKLFLYGPFKRGGELISEGDKNFDTSIRASDPEVGYKDDNWIISTAKKNGLALDQAIEMPANNLALIFVKET